jgi:hypothetical protein
MKNELLGRKYIWQENGEEYTLSLIAQSKVFLINPETNEQLKFSAFDFDRLVESGDLIFANANFIDKLVQNFSDGLVKSFEKNLTNLREGGEEVYNPDALTAIIQYETFFDEIAKSLGDIKRQMHILKNEWTGDASVTPADWYDYEAEEEYYASIHDGIEKFERGA